MESQSRYLKNRKTQDSASTDEHVDSVPATTKKITVITNKTSRISFLDILRTITGLFLLSASLSYFIVGDSLTWGYHPKWARWGAIRGLWTPPLALTIDQLALYNGTDPSLPIYLSINGTIYDVTTGASKYGPGGSYSFFAGRDATRAYVSGCFQEDLTYDLRGLEDMFEGEVPDAKAEVDRRVKHWADFFDRHEEYYEVGNLVKEENWEEKMPLRKLCKQAGGEEKMRKAAEIRRERAWLATAKGRMQYE